MSIISPASTEVTGIHVIPGDSSSSHYNYEANPLEGRRFGAASPNLERGEFLNDVNFNSPAPGSRRGPLHGQFGFQDQDEDDDDCLSYRKITQTDPKGSKYGPV
jgi:hypothetical protein